MKGRKEPAAQETFSHHVLPATDEFCHPLEILTGRKTRVVPECDEKKVETVTAADIEAVTGLLL
jgi:hypothetical protein